MRNFTSIKDVGNPQLLIAECLHIKQFPQLLQPAGAGKTIGLIFMNPSLRTRISSQKAAAMLGMNVITMNMDRESWAIEWNDHVIMNGSTVEHIRDAAGVLGQYCDILALRSFPGLQNREEDYSEKILSQFIRYAGVPVVSLESATLHPLQSLADAMTIKETWDKPYRPKVVLTWAPHIKALPQAVPNSFAQWMTNLDVDFTITHPEGYELADQFTKGATIVHNQHQALENADYVYVKSWSAYRDYGRMPAVKGNWGLDPYSYSLTAGARIMHCLPLRRNLELNDEFADHNRSVISIQAINRLYAALGVFKSILESNRDQSEISTNQILAAQKEH